MRCMLRPFQNGCSHWCTVRVACTHDQQVKAKVFHKELNPFSWVRHCKKNDHSIISLTYTWPMWMILKCHALMWYCYFTGRDFTWCQIRYFSHGTSMICYQITLVSSLSDPLFFFSGWACRNRSQSNNSSWTPHFICNAQCRTRFHSPPFTNACHLPITRAGSRRDWWPGQFPAAQFSRHRKEFHRPALLDTLQCCWYHTPHIGDNTCRFCKVLSDRRVSAYQHTCRHWDDTNFACSVHFSHSAHHLSVACRC